MEGLLKDTRESIEVEVNIEKGPEGAWIGKLITGEVRGTVPAAAAMPQHKEAHSLFKAWQTRSRINGDIPGGTLMPLVRTMTRFITLNPSHEASPKLGELLKRIDTTHDWTQTETVALLDDVTDCYPALPKWVEGENRFSLGRRIYCGQPLAADLQNAPWGEPQPNGLRVAWLLSPQAEQYRLGTALKSRILFHNTGKNTVLFRALTWYQSAYHKARNAVGDDIKINSTHWTTIPLEVVCRLEPGEFAESHAAGIGVGSDGDEEDWQQVRVGSRISANVGEEVTLTPAPVSVEGRRNMGSADDGPDWWLAFIKDRLSLDAPLPAIEGERKQILDRAIRDLFGSDPTAEELATFIADRSPHALDLLAIRLSQRAGITTFTGSLPCGETTFRVLAADPEAASEPRRANNPGRYKLSGGAVLAISRRPNGDRIVNEAKIQFSSSDASKPAPGEYEVKLPDGYGTWSAAWVRDTTKVWVTQNGIVRSYDFSNPSEVKVSFYQQPRNFVIPEKILEALRTALGVPAENKVSPPASDK